MDTSKNELKTHPHHHPPKKLEGSSNTPCSTLSDVDVRKEWPDIDTTSDASYLDGRKPHPDEIICTDRLYADINFDGHLLLEAVEDEDSRCVRLTPQHARELAEHLCHLADAVEQTEKETVARWN